MNYDGRRTTNDEQINPLRLILQFLPLRDVARWRDHQSQSRDSKKAERGGAIQPTYPNNSSVELLYAINQTVIIQKATKSIVAVFDV